MATGKDKRNTTRAKRSKKPTTVPVTHRSVTAPAAARSPRRSPRRPIAMTLYSGWQWLVIIIALILILLMVSTPLHNMFQQSGQIARLTQQVAEKKAKKHAMLDELARYRSDSYIKEQARTRLGLINPGETAYRIIAPTPPQAPTGPTTPDGTPTDSLGPWYQVMWDSIARPEKAPVLPVEQQRHGGVPVTPDPGHPSPAPPGPGVPPAPAPAPGPAPAPAPGPAAPPPPQH